MNIKNLIKKNQNIILINIAFFTISFISTSIGPIVNILISYSKITISQGANILASRSLGYLLGAYLSIFTFKKLNYRCVCFYYFIIMGALMLGLEINQSYLTYIFIFLFFGVIKNLITVGGNQYFASILKSENDNSLNILHFLYGVGTMLSPLLVGYILEKYQIEVLFIIFIIISLLNALLLSYKKPKIKYNQTQNIKIEKIINNKSKNVFSNTLNIFIILIFFGIYASAEIYIGSWGAYVFGNNELTKDYTYILNSIFWASLCFSKIILLPLVKKYKQTTVIYFSLFICITTSILLLFNTGFLIFLVMGVLGLSMGNIVPIIIKYATIENKITSNQSAWCFVGAGIGGVISSKLFGKIIEFDIQSSKIIFIILFCVLTLLFFQFTKTTKKAEIITT